MQCVAVCRSVSQCVAVCRSVSQRVAVCCSVLQCVAVGRRICAVDLDLASTLLRATITAQSSVAAMIVVDV